MKFYRRALMPCILLLALLVFPAVVQAHAAAGTGRISGQILDGTKHHAPVAGQSVTLQAAQNNTGKDVTSVKTDARGNFSFGNLDTSKTLSYAVYTRYQGAQYYTDLIDLSTRAVQQVRLTVYDATTSTANIAIGRATVLINDPDPKTGIISISEIFGFKNLGTNTYVGSLDTSKGKPNALRFALPPGARNVNLSRGFDGYQAVQVDRGFATDAAVPPGDSEFAFSFQVMYTASTFDFSYGVIYPTVQLAVLVPPSLHVTSSSLSSEGLVNTNQHTYVLFQGNGLLAGKEAHIKFEGLPTPATATNVSTLNPAWLWLVVGLLIMLALIVVTSFLYRVTHREQDSRRGGQKPYARKEPQRRGGAAAQPTKHVPQNAEEKLLQELLDLDKAFEAGKIKKADYEDRRAKTRARLRALMGEAAPRGGRS